VSVLLAAATTLAVLAATGARWSDLRAPAARGVPTAGGPPRRRPDPLPALGRLARAAVRRRPDPAADRRAGAVVAVAMGAVALGPVPALAVAALVALLARARRLRRRRAPGRAAGVEREVPDLVDLLALAVGAGVPVPAALPAIAPHVPDALRADVAAAVDALAGGRPSDEVVVELGARWGPPARPLVHALADHLRYGTPVLPALERVAADARAARRRAAETRARRLPVLLLLPLVLCTLPAFGLLTVAPLVAGTFDSLRGGHLEAPASVAP